jgi:hypothetical protein
MRSTFCPATQVAACAVICGGVAVGVGVGLGRQSRHFSMVKRTTYHGSFTNTTVRVQQKTQPSEVVYVPAKYDEPSCCFRFVIANPGIRFGR